jgi:hypothetical protein
MGTTSTGDDMPTKSHQWAISRGIVLAAMVLATSAACVDVPAPVDGRITTDAPLPGLSGTASGAGASGRWSSLAAPCPALGGPAATALKRQGAGRERAGTSKTTMSYQAFCDFGPTGDQPPQVFAKVFIVTTSVEDATAEQVATRAFGKARDGAREGDATVAVEQQPGIGDEAYVLINPRKNAIDLSVRTANAVVTASIIIAWDADDQAQAQAQRLKQLRPAVTEVAQAMLSELH